jgi:hypothetical protein
MRVRNECKNCGVDYDLWQTPLKTCSATVPMYPSRKDAPGPSLVPRAKNDLSGCKTDATKWLGSVGDRLFTVALNCEGMNRTGNNPSQHRLINIVTIWSKITPTRDARFARLCSRASKKNVYRKDFVDTHCPQEAVCIPCGLAPSPASPTSVVSGSIVLISSRHSSRTFFSKALMSTIVAAD